MKKSLSLKRPLSLPMIWRLNRGMEIPADILIVDVETDSSIFSQDPEIDYSRFPLQEMLERGCFGDFKGNVQRVKDYAEDLVTKFKREFLPKHLEPAFLRALMHQRGDRQADDMALLAWRMCVVRSAREANLSRKYKPGSVTPEWLRELAKLLAFEEGPKLARECLARLGIILVIESEADEMAQEALIPKNRWDAAKVKETLLSEDAITFADEVGVHPAIIAGCLRHATKNFRLLSHFIGKTGQVSQHFVQ